jgi:acetoacetyl-CoA synthetase
MSEGPAAGTRTARSAEPDVLWSPPPDVRERTRMGRYMGWLEAERGLAFDGYPELWRWSTTDLAGFWQSIWDYYGVTAHEPPSGVLASAEMPGARWFPGARLNFAEHLLRQGEDAEVAIFARSQTRGDVVLTWGDLRADVARARAGLRRLGVGPGDRVAAYLPNVPEAVITFLAAASLGAVWCACPPEFGIRSAVDRLRQVAPKVLVTVDGYRWGEKVVSRRDEVAGLREAIESLEAVVLVPYLDAEPAGFGETVRWPELLADTEALECLPVDFDHPLWVLFSSGTTGLPKPIVHGHGGTLVEQLKVLGLHHDLGPGDRKFFFSTTGWMVWNQVVSSLLMGASIVLLDGNPVHPDLDAMWALAAETRATLFGAGASYYMRCREQGLDPAATHDLSSIRYLKAAGSTLPDAGYRWLAERFPGVFFSSSSGGTDICSGLLGGIPILPVRAGEMAAPWLGAKVEAYDESGTPVLERFGQLVVTAPMPSMPVAFYGDTDGERYRAAYFDAFPGVWAHGDWLKITSRGTCILGGRSDATLNRGGVRLGTAEFYAVLDAQPGIEDTLVVHLEDPQGGLGDLLMFVVLADGTELDDDLRRGIAQRVRGALSPRHVPDDVIAVPAIPRGLTGKRLEVPVKRILQGAPPAQACPPGSLQDASVLDPFVALAPAGTPASA